MDEHLPVTAISVVVHRDAKSQLRFSVAAQVPRKRMDADDTVSSTLRTFLFWDDKRNFSHFDSLLTQLAPVNVVHLACTEKAEVSLFKKLDENE